MCVGNEVVCLWGVLEMARNWGSDLPLKAEDGVMYIYENLFTPTLVSNKCVPKPPLP